MKKRMRNKGFTLVELLIVVAIIAVLASIGFVSVTQWRKTLKQTEYDSQARSIFVAAQNHLSSYGAANLAQISKDDYAWGFEDDMRRADDSAFSDYYFFTSNRGSGFTGTATSNEVLKIMLPAGSVDDTLRLGGNFYIRYAVDPSTSMANVLDVLYAEFSDANAGFSMAEAHELIKASADTRKKYEKGVVGYYGGASMDSVERGEALISPQISVVNSDTLYVEVTDPNYDRYATERSSLSLVISGKGESGEDVEAAIPLRDENKDVVTPVGSKYTYTLDDVTTEGEHFANIEALKAFAPGCNISIKARVVNTTKLTQNAESVSETTNSLYYDARPGVVYIRNFRHLENLSADISGTKLAEQKISRARQENSLIVDGDDYWNNAQIVNLDKSKTTAYGHFMPVSLPVPDSLQAFSYAGGDNIIKGIRIDEEGDAGLFGSLEKVNVSGLTLLNFSVTSTKGSAGALAGEMTGGVVSRVLVRNEYTKDNNNHYEGLAIKGYKAAGGLVGTMNGGSIDDSAAAVFVQAEHGPAGGMLGSGSGTVIITDSYSGGHTLAARYSNITAEEAGRVNVIAAEGYTAGGLVGSAETVGLEYSYSSCSVLGTAAGGLAGYAQGGMIKDCYAVGRVMDYDTAAKTAPLLGGGDAGYAGTNYYLTNISENTRLVEDENVVGVSGTDTAVTEFIKPERARADAIPYDNTLAVEYKGKYFFPTVAQLDPEGAAAVDYLSVHYGDFQVPGLTALDFVLRNVDTLYLESVLDKDDDVAYMLVEGVSSEATKVFVLKKKSELLAKPVFELSAEGSISENGAYDMLDEVKTDLKIEYDDTTGLLKVYLDDVSAAGQHFAQLFPEFTPGENINVYFVADTPSSKELKELEPWTDNSLFARAIVSGNEAARDAALKDYSTAGIEYIRHLQNLDPAVSDVDEKVTKAVVQAEDNLDWAEKYAAGFYNYIYNKEGGKYVEKTFYPVYNSKLASFDGQGFRLKNFVINVSGSEAENFGESTGLGNAGLFRYADAPGFTIKNVKLEDFVVTTTAADGNAAVAVAELAANNAKIEGVLAVSKDKEVNAKDGAAGGLVGELSATATIDNSAASVLLRTAGAAGGLLGWQSGGELVISNSYSGGHTITKAGNSVYDVNAAAAANVYSSGSYAGGLAGFLAGGDVRISNSFSAASVAGAGAAGGIAGSVTAQLYFVKGEPVYVIAPVFGLKADNTGLTDKGAFLGSLGRTVTVPVDTLYYLPEVYDGYVLGVEESQVLTVGNGSKDMLGGDGVVNPAYYDTSGNNAIAAKVHLGNMQAYTSTFNDSLYRREYPFTIWTDFHFDYYAGYTNVREYSFSYYGDWQPVNAPATVPINLRLRYTVSANRAEGKVAATSTVSVNSSKESLNGNNDGLWNQTIAKDRDNTALLPSMKTMFGYKRERSWLLYRSTGEEADGYAQYSLVKDGDNKPVKIKESSGVVNIAAEYCTADLLLVDNYEMDGSKIRAYFYWDKSGNNNYGGGTKSESYVTKLSSAGEEELNIVEALAGGEGAAAAIDALGDGSDDFVLLFDTQDRFMGSMSTEEFEALSESEVASVAQVIKTQTLPAATGKYLDLKPPTRSIRDHVFDGWYEDTALTVSANFTKDKLLGGDKNFYARYDSAETTQLTLDFLYVAFDPKGDANKAKDMFMYSVSENVPQYKISFVESQGFKGWVEIPESLSELNQYSFVFLGKYENGETKIVADFNNKTRFETEKSGSYTNYKKVYLDTVEDNTTSYRLIYYKKDVEMVTYKLRYIMDDTSSGSTDSNFIYRADDEYVWYPGRTIDVPAGENPWNEYTLEELADDIDGFTAYTVVNEDLKSEDGSNYIVIHYKRNSYTLSFDSDGGSYVRPVTKVFGETLSNPSTTPTRKGYSFNKWYAYYDFGGDSANPTEFSISGGVWSITMPAKNIVAKAKWDPGKNAKYTVVIWYENANNDDYAYMYSFKETGQTVGTTVSSSAYSNQNNLYRFQGWDNDHFTFNSAKAESVKIEADDSSVLNVYFSRSEITIYFYAKITKVNNLNDKTKDYVTAQNGGYCLVYNDEEKSVWKIDVYNKETGSSGTQYAIVDGQYVELGRDDINKIVWIPSALYTKANSVTSGTGTKYYKVVDGEYVEMSGRGYSNSFYETISQSDMVTSGTYYCFIENSRYQLSYNNGNWRYYRNKKWNNISGSTQCYVIYSGTLFTKSTNNLTKKEGIQHYIKLGDGSFSATNESENLGMTHYYNDGYAYVELNQNTETTAVWTLNGMEYSGTRYMKSGSQGTYNGKLYEKNGDSFTVTAATSGDLYGLDSNGAYLKLTEGKIATGWIYYDSDGVLHEYNSTSAYQVTGKYDSSNKNYFTWRGKYLAAFETYHYSWSMVDDYKWKECKKNGDDFSGQLVQTFLSAFTETYSTSSTEYYLKYDGSKGSDKIIHYRQGLDGKYKEAEGDVAYGSVSTSKFNFNNKYEEFEVSSYSLGNEAFSEDGGLHTTSKGQSVSNPGSPLKVFHSRKQWILSYDVYNEVTETDETTKEYSVYFDMPLFTAEKDGEVQTRAGIYQAGDEFKDESGKVIATFSGWYLETTCSEGSELKVGEKMPNGPMRLYGKWIPEPHTVTFHLEGGAMAAAGTADTLSITVPHNKKLDDVAGVDAADDKGNWTSDYTPVKLIPKLSESEPDEYYGFEGWFIRTGTYDENNEEILESFVPTQNIRQNYDVYAEWNNPETRTMVRVHIYDLLQNADGTYPAASAENERTDKEYYGPLNGLFSAEANSYEGYTAERLRMYTIVKEDPEDSGINRIEFKYTKDKEWAYSVEYRLSISSYESSDLSFGGEKSLAPGAQAYVPVVGGNPEVKSTNNYETVVFNLPDDYKLYHLKRYEVKYDDSDEIREGSGEYVTIKQPEGGEGSVTVTFYIEPDPTQIIPADKTVQYDGTSHAKASCVASGDKALASESTTDLITAMDDGEKYGANPFNLPGGASMKVWYVYCDDDGKVLNVSEDGTAVRNVGSYYMHVYVTVEADGKLYLLWKSEDESLSLKITQRVIYLKSRSASAYIGVDDVLRYKENYPEIDAWKDQPVPGGSLSFDWVDVIKKDGVGDEFVAGEEPNYVFSVEAFRGSEGSWDNIFEVEPKDGVDKDTFDRNYRISREYGVLTVSGAQDWKYRVEYYLRYASNAEPGGDAKEAFKEHFGEVAELPGNSAEYKVLAAPVWTSEVVNSDTRYEQYTVAVPEEYGNYYHYTGYEYGTKSGSGSDISISANELAASNYAQDGVRVLKCYLELNPEAFTLDGLEVPKGSTVGGIEVRGIVSENTAEEGKTVWEEVKEGYKPGEGAELAYRYLVHKSDGDLKDSESLYYGKSTTFDTANEDGYGMDVYLTVTVDGTTYLIAKAEEDKGAKKLVITADGDAITEAENITPASDDPTRLIDLGPADGDGSVSDNDAEDRRSVSENSVSGNDADGENGSGSGDGEELPPQDDANKPEEGVDGGEGSGSGSSDGNGNGDGSGSGSSDDLGDDGSGSDSGSSTDNSSGSSGDSSAGDAAIPEAVTAEPASTTPTREEGDGV